MKYWLDSQMKDVFVSWQPLSYVYDRSVSLTSAITRTGYFTLPNSSYQEYFQNQDSSFQQRYNDVYSTANTFM